MCVEECFYQGVSNHPTSCLAELPFALSQQCSQGPSFSQAQASSAYPESLLSHPLSSSALSGSHSASPPYTLIYITLLSVRPEQRHSFERRRRILQVLRNQMQLPPAFLIFSAQHSPSFPSSHTPRACCGPPARVPELNKTPPCCRLLQAAFQYNPERSLSLSSLVS